MSAKVEGIDFRISASPPRLRGRITWEALKHARPGRWQWEGGAGQGSSFVLFCFVFKLHKIPGCSQDGEPCSAVLAGLGLYAGFPCVHMFSQPPSQAAVPEVGTWTGVRTAPGKRTRGTTEQGP